MTKSNIPMNEPFVQLQGDFDFALDVAEELNRLIARFKPGNEDGTHICLVANGLVLDEVGVAQPGLVFLFGTDKDGDPSAVLLHPSQLAVNIIGLPKSQKATLEMGFHTLRQDARPSQSREKRLKRGV